MEGQSNTIKVRVVLKFGQSLQNEIFRKNIKYSLWDIINRGVRNGLPNTEKKVL